jgi:hypothetical protein
VRSKKAIEQRETNSEIHVHQPFVVDHLMMEIVALASSEKPPPKEWISRHPEVPDVHSVVDVAESDKTPRQRKENKGELKYDSHMKQVQCENAYEQQNPARNNPLQTHTPQGRPVAGCADIFRLGALLTQRSIQQQVVLHMSPAENVNPIGVQQSVKEIAQELGDKARADGPCHESN